MTSGGQLARWADRGQARDFDRRYSRDSVGFWVSRFAELGPIGSDDLVLDVGCGTGGFAVGMAGTGARVIACDLVPDFVDFAREKESPVTWLVADAQNLPLAERSVDCVIMSLLLHRLPDPARDHRGAPRAPARRLAVDQDHRTGRRGRTLPYRLFPTMAAAQRARLPEIVMITDWATAAGFTELVQERVVRDRLVDAARLAATVRADVEIRYPDLPADELGRGLRSLEELATWHLGWSEPRTTTLVRAIVG